MRTEETKLRELLGEMVAADEHILAALNRKLAALQQPPLGSLDEVEERKVAAVARSRSPEDAQRAARLQAVSNLATTLRTTSGLIKAYRQLYCEVEKLQQNAAQMREIMFQEVLVASRRLVVEFQLDYCPVCLREIERDVLLASLEERVCKAEVITQKTAAIKRLRAQIEAQVRDQIAQAGRLAEQSCELPARPDRRPLEQYTAWLQDILASTKPDPVDMRLESADSIAQSPQAIAFAAYLDTLLAESESELDRLEPTEQDQQVVAVIDLLTRSMDSRQELLKLRPQCAVKTAAHQEMAAVFDCFVNTKRAQIQGIYSELESDIGRYFGYLHTGEGHGRVKLAIQEGRRASTEIKVDFHKRQQEDPRGFNSEGHLDSLGLCVFLAFVKRFNAGFPLLVLDDVVSSIDSGHRQHICDLLLQEFGEYQLFITTHDYVWFEELCAHQRTHKATHRFVNWQILDWSLDAGPRLDQYKPRWERIEAKLASGDKDGAAADARKALECFLYEMAITTKTPIELKRDNRYTVGDLYNPFVSRVKKLVPEVHKDNLRVFEEMDKCVIFGNMLVHNNPPAGNASLEEVRGFVNAVRELEALFTCAQCGRRVGYHRDAEIIKCRCCNGISWPTKG